MIDDIVFEVNTFILELPIGTPGGDIDSYSSDGSNYDFVNIINTGYTESSYTFIS
jgi:hypothetical protein